MSDVTIQHFHHAGTGTLSYVVSDPTTARAAVIDPVLGFCAVSGRTDRSPLDEIIGYVRDASLSLDWILETHAHADHLTGAQILQSELGGKIGIGAGIRDVQAHFAGVFNLQAPFAADGSQFDRLFEDGDAFAIGGIEARVLATPGHTNDSITYVMADAAFIGDTLFMPDVGTARCDFPGGDAALLYDSIHKILALPESTRLHVCHDYPPTGQDGEPLRPMRFEVSVAEQKRDNIHVGGSVTRQDYVAMREARDRTLGLPALIIPPIQVNMRAGSVPAPDDNGVSYLRTPVDLL